jgi:hypothetical protein
MMTKEPVLARCMFLSSDCCCVWGFVLFSMQLCVQRDCSCSKTLAVDNDRRPVGRRARDNFGLK